MTVQRTAVPRQPLFPEPLPKTTDLHQIYSGILEGVVRVGQGNVTLNSDTDVQAIKAAGVTLTIEAGTDVRARGDGTLLVTRGSKIMAEGTRTAHHYLQL